MPPPHAQFRPSLPVLRQRDGSPDQEPIRRRRLGALVGLAPRLHHAARQGSWAAIAHRSLLLLAAALLLVGVQAAPAGAVGSFGPPVTIDAPGCKPTGFNVDLAQDDQGVTHGFEGLWDSDCNSDLRISYFQGSGATWTREATPYRGIVVAVAHDATGTYLLYVDAARLELRITKRLADGTYTPGRLLSTHVHPDGSLAEGDLVAADGRWWAVWREHVAAGGRPGDEFDQTDLFQAQTLGGTFRGRQRITTHPQWDSQPALAHTPDTTFPLTLVWVRGGSDFGPPSPSHLRLASGDAKDWASRSLATLGGLNLSPDVAVAGSTTYVAWNRDGQAVVADNAAGAFQSHTFATPAYQHADAQPHIAVSPGSVVVGWTAPTATGLRAFVAELEGGRWSGAYASPSSATRMQFLQGVASVDGTATAVIVSFGSRLYATTEQ